MMDRRLPDGTLSDGCSGSLSKGWKWLTKTLPPFEDCCIDHDREYVIGGNSADRWAADIELFKCVHAYSVSWSYIVFFAVRVLGEFDWVWKWKKYTYTIDK